MTASDSGVGIEPYGEGARRTHGLTAAAGLAEAPAATIGAASNGVRVGVAGL